MDYYKILNVQRDCTDEDLRRAFRRLSLSTHPDRFQDEERSRAEQEYQLIVKAFNTLKDATQREKYNQTIAREFANPRTNKGQSTNDLEAMKYEKAGISYYKKGQFDHAVEFLGKAAYMKPNSNVYYYKGLAESKIHGKRKDAMTSLQKAIDADAYQVKYRVAIVECMFEMGLKTKAQKTLGEALSLFPADQRLQDLQSKFFGNQEEKGNLVKDLFSVFRGKQ